MPYSPAEDAHATASVQGELDNAVRPAPSNRGVVGILGGMGPVATADFYLKLVQATPAGSDQDHLRTLIWSDPTIPDRTRALLEHGSDPTPAMIAGARLLESSGASLLAVPCNTAHAFVPAVQKAVGIPIIHMIEETANYIAGIRPEMTRVGLLATTGTVEANLYQKWLDKKGIKVITPTGDGQVTVMSAIRSIKAGDVSPAIRTSLKAAADNLVQEGAQAVIAGCTEIPIGLDVADISVPLIDPARILAASVVDRINAPIAAAKAAS